MEFDVKSYVEENLDSVKRSKGDELEADCPWCGKPGHFYINIDSGEHICFKCGEAGRTVVGLIAHVEGLTRSEAWQWLYKRVVKRRRRETAPSLVEKVRSLRAATDIHTTSVENKVEVPLPDEYIPVYTDGKWRMPAYLKRRGIDKQTARRWGLGYCRRGRYADRIIIPIECPNGHSFTSRDAGAGHEPKYLNPKDADHGRLFHGWKRDKVGSDVVIVEGPLDVIRLDQHGMFSLAMFGKTLKAGQLRLLSMWPTDASVIVMADPEEVMAPLEIATQLVARFEHVYIARLPLGVDPGDSTKEQAWAAYESAERFRGERSAKINAAIALAQKKLGKIYQR